MAGVLRQFDPDKNMVSWAIKGGATIDLTEGLIDGPTAIVEAKDGPLWTRRGDRQGNMVRNKSSKKGGTLTLTYVAESELQDVLSAIQIADGVTATSVGTITIKDLNGSTLMIYNGAFIEDDPTHQYGDAAGDRSFVFGYAERVPFHGGSSPKS